MWHLARSCGRHANAGLLLCLSQPSERSGRAGLPCLLLPAGMGRQGYAGLGWQKKIFWFLGSGLPLWQAGFRLGGRCFDCRGEPAGRHQ